MAHRSASYRRRAAVSFVTNSTATTMDAEFAVPAGWDEFWAAIDSSGHGVRVTEGDGLTAVDYEWTGFNKTNKAGTLKLGAVTTPGAAGRCVLVWVYYDVDSPTDGSTTVTTSTPRTAVLDMAKPDPEYTITVRRQSPGEDLPEDRVAKAPDEQLFVWLDFGAIVQTSDRPYNGRTSWEEPSIGDAEVIDTSGSAVGTMIDLAESRWVSVKDGSRDRLYLKLRVKAGTDSTWYTLVGQAWTSTPDDSPYRTIIATVGIYVRKQRRT